MRQDMDKEMRFAAWCAKVAAFEGCPLKAGATRPVFGEGVLNPQVLIMGEAPGAEEDRLGRPFVGRSGKLLDQMLASVGLSRAENVFISNACYWRPPENRTPTPAEVASCRPFMHELIDLLKPRMMLLVGRTAALAVLQSEESMACMRQQWHDLKVPGWDKPLNVRVTFHPAYLLRNPPAKPDAMADLQLVRAAL